MSLSLAPVIAEGQVWLSCLISCKGKVQGKTHVEKSIDLHGTKIVLQENQALEFNNKADVLCFSPLVVFFCNHLLANKETHHFGPMLSLLEEEMAGRQPVLIS